MSPTYEYIVAVLISILMLGYTYYSITTLSNNQLQLVEEEQLDIIASRLFDKILLTQGYPEDWGSNIFVNNTSLKDFGLGLSHGKLYNLDVDKVTRLSGSTNPLYINNKTFGALTGLYDAEKGYWKYGFRFYLKTALNITIQKADTKPITEKFKINVKNHMGKSTPNVEVKGTYIAVYVVDEQKGKEKEEYLKYDFKTTYNMTNWIGETILDYKNNIPQVPSGVKTKAYFLIVSANYYGIQSQQFYIENTIETLELTIQGKYLIAEYGDGGLHIPKGAHHLQLDVIALTSSLTIIQNPIQNVTQGEAGKIINYGNKKYQVYELENEPSQDLIFVGLLVKKTGKWHLAFASRPRTPVSVDYSIGLKSAGIKTVTLSRIVRIGANSYYAELTLWRMSE